MIKTKLVLSSMSTGYLKGNLVFVSFLSNGSRYRSPVSCRPSVFGFNRSRLLCLRATPMRPSLQGLFCSRPFRNFPRFHTFFLLNKKLSTGFVVEMFALSTISRRTYLLFLLQVEVPFGTSTVPVAREHNTKRHKNKQPLPSNSGPNGGLYSGSTW